MCERLTEALGNRWAKAMEGKMDRSKPDVF